MAVSLLNVFYYIIQHRSIKALKVVKYLILCMHIQMHWTVNLGKQNVLVVVRRELNFVKVNIPN